VTQSAVSQQISSLERLFKSLLIERARRSSASPGRTGALRLQQAGDRDVRRPAQQAARDQRHHLRTIRVATIYSIGLHDLPPYLKKFLKSYPTVNVQSNIARHQVYEDVLGNVVDLGWWLTRCATEIGNLPAAQDCWC